MTGQVPHDPLSLLGRWTFTRDIDDHRAGERITVAGAMLLRGDADGIQWDETGTMTRSGVASDVFRTLFLAPRAGGWFVTFADGRDFHPWAVGEALSHPCSADLYSGRIDVAADANSWVVHWDVTGPAKDYHMETRITRAGRPGTHPGLPDDDERHPMTTVRGRSRAPHLPSCRASASRGSTTA